MTLYVAAQHHFYRCVKAVKGLLMTVMFAQLELWQVGAVPNVAYCLSVQVSI